jgi:hypothetical protein
MARLLIRALPRRLGEQGRVRVIIFDGFIPWRHPLPFASASKAARTLREDAKFFLGAL